MTTMPKKRAAYPCIFIQYSKIYFMKYNEISFPYLDKYTSACYTLRENNEKRAQSLARYPLFVVVCPVFLSFGRKHIVLVLPSEVSF